MKSRVKQMKMEVHAADLGNTLGASPVSNRDFIQWWKKTECVIRIITAITQQQKTLHIPKTAYFTEVLICRLHTKTIKPLLTLYFCRKHSSSIKYMSLASSCSNLSKLIHSNRKRYLGHQPAKELSNSTVNHYLFHLFNQFNILSNITVVT